MILATVLGTLFVVAAATLVGWHNRTDKRRHNRRLHLIEQRRQRVAEDVCWQLCRTDAYADAIRCTVRRGDRRLLWMLSEPAERLRVVS